MKLFTILISFLFLLFGCKDTKTSPKKKEKDIPTAIIKKHKNEVVLVLKDSIEHLSMNIRTSPYQLKSDLMSIGTKHQNNMVVIPTDSILKLFIGHTYTYAVKANFIKGDTVHIKYMKSYANKETIDYPYYSIANRDHSTYELNFDYYVSLKTPTVMTFRRYKMFSRMRGWKNPSTIDEVYKNIISVADSLYAKKLLSKEFHTKKIAEATLLKTQHYLYNAFTEKTPINIDSLIGSVQNNLQVEYSSLQNLLISAINYKYYLNRKKYAKGSVLFDVILKKDTLLKPAFKNAVLDKLLTRVYISEPHIFNNYLEKFKELAPNSSKYIKKYNAILVEKEAIKRTSALAKKHTGKLFTLKSEKYLDYKSVLKKEIGKVILVDFWASWCAPCRTDIPALKMLQKEIDSSQFTVISISIDKNINAWKKASEQEQLTDKQHNYLLLNPDKSSLVKDLKINLIPRYLIYNKKGELVNVDAPRPSDNEKIRILLNKYLTE